MPHSRSVDDDGILVTRVSGVYTLEDALDLQNSLQEYIVDGEVYELFIHANDVEMHWNANEALVSANTFGKTLKMLKKAAIAFVSGSNLVFGLCRQLQIQVENEFIQICVFRNEDTAHRWLLELKLSNMVESIGI